MCTLHFLVVDTTTRKSTFCLQLNSFLYDRQKASYPLTYKALGAQLGETMQVLEIEFVICTCPLSGRRIMLNNDYVNLGGYYAESRELNTAA
jgi:hypothetical protein